MLLIDAHPERAGLAARRLEAKGYSAVSWLAAPASALLRIAPSETGPENSFAWEAPRLLSAHASLLPRQGRALDLACGSGRAAVFLATRGLEARGLDILPDALRQARATARSASRTARSDGRVRFTGADLEDPRVQARWLRPDRWDVVVCFRYLDRQILPLIARTLAPGGLLWYETFLEEQARVHGRPRREAFLLRPGELLDAFAGLERVEYAEGPDEEQNHLASLIARRPRQKPGRAS